MELVGPFTKEEIAYLDGFDLWKMWKEQISDTYSIYYAWREGWPLDNRIIKHTFKEFIIDLDLYEGNYPKGETPDRYHETYQMRPIKKEDVLPQLSENSPLKPLMREDMVRGSKLFNQNPPKPPEREMKRIKQDKQDEQGEQVKPSKRYLRFPDVDV